MSNVVLPTIYRQLLRLGRQLDANPLSKALLLAQPSLLFDRRSRELITLPKLHGAAGQWSAHLSSFNGGEFYVPEASARAEIKASRSTIPATDDPVGVGLSALRALSLAVEGGAALESHAFDCGSPSAVDRVTSIRPRGADDVRAGSLLLTHPVSCLQQPTLHHSVILITHVDSDFVTGLVINKRLDVTLGGAVRSESARDDIGEVLAAAPLYKGGDVQEGSLLILHEFRHLENSVAIGDTGLHMTSDVGEVRAALDARAAQETDRQAHPGAAGGFQGMGSEAGGAATRAPPSGGVRLRLVAGYAGWARTQLGAELARNVWFHLGADDVAALTMMDPPSGMESEHLRDVMWSGALRALGDEYEALSRFPGDHDLVWGQMQQLWEKQSDELHRRIEMLDRDNEEA